MSKIDIHFIIPGTAEYTQELILRDEVLRKPLGLSLFNEDLSKETNDYHIGAFLDDHLVGILILTVLNDKEIKMRQVAVKENKRGMSVGTELVKFAENFSKSKDYKIIVLNARKTAVNFYKKLNYEIISDEFIEVNIPHYKMKKLL